MTSTSATTSARIEFNKDVKSFNSLNLPGRAEQFAQFSSISELLSLLAYARQQKLTVKVLGGGSNILMPARVSGLVLQSAMQSVEVLRQDEQSISLKVDAGKHWHSWVLESQQYGHGIENLALIPGTVGASPIQNIGAYGVEVADVLESVQGICLSSMQLMTLSNADCRFGYRDSIFKRELKDDFIVTSATFRLTKAFAPNVSYGPLASWASDHSGFSSQHLIDQVCAIRSSKLPDPTDIPNAGSFFKNPVVSAAEAGKLRTQYPNMPGYPQADGRVKLAAGWLIEQAGWKGRSLGNASMHSLQALVLTTNGSAELSDVFAIRDAVRADVFELFGVQLEPEPQLF
ncbi:MAG: UDP-N-acetylmuramate dehydrogenase [Pseudomonadota bacterium]